MGRTPLDTGALAPSGAAVLTKSEPPAPSADNNSPATALGTGSVTVRIPVSMATAGTYIAVGDTRRPILNIHEKELP
jgi:hypothetical protein